MKRNIIEITEHGTITIPSEIVWMSEEELVSLFGVIAPSVRTGEPERAAGTHPAGAGRETPAAPDTETTEYGTLNRHLFCDWKSLAGAFSF